MSMNFRYVFEEKGAIVPKQILDNDVWIDVGNNVRDGVFDHHQDQKEHQDQQYASAFECVIKRADCYKKINRYRGSKHENPEVIFHVHEYPDIDCIFSIFAIRRMIRQGVNTPAEAFDTASLSQMMDYVNTIDSGRGKYISKATLYAYVCGIGGDIKDIRARSQEMIDEGLRLLELVVSALEKSEVQIELFTTSLEDYVNISTLKYFPNLQNRLLKIKENYQKDKNENRIVLKKVNLWNKKSGAMELVTAAIWEQLPSGEDEYNFARDDDECLLTVYPYKIKEETTLLAENQSGFSTNDVTRVIIALNPNMPEADEYSLRPLAEMIEQSEQIEENLLYERTKRYRRDHSQSRRDHSQSEKEHERFDELPFLETSDPWYFSEKEDIIDAPRADSIIPYKRILTLIESESSIPLKACVLQYRSEHGQIRMEQEECLGKISFGDLYKETQKMIEALKSDDDLEHLFMLVEIDPSMLRYSNHFLRACCMNMVGKSDDTCSCGNILQIDYRTCLFTDQSITILAAVNRRNLSLSSLIEENHLSQSRLCIDLKKILEHQSELRSIGISLSDTIQKIAQESEEIDRFNERLVRLSTRMEEDDLSVNSLEQKVYSFIKEILGIEALKNSVATSAQLLIKNAEQLRDRKASEDRRNQEMREKEANEAEEKRDQLIQTGIGLTAVLAIFSALVDAFDFIAKFVPGNDEGWSYVKSCPNVYKVEVSFFIVILVVGIMAAIYAVIAWKKAKDQIKRNTEENSNSCSKHIDK